MYSGLPLDKTSNSRPPTLVLSPPPTLDTLMRQSNTSFAPSGNPHSNLLQHPCPVFHATCADAIPLQSYANRLYEHFGKTPALSFVSLEEFRRRLSPEDYECSMDHITHSPCCSMEKAKNLLGFVPSHSCLQTVLDAISDRF